MSASVFRQVVECEATTLHAGPGGEIWRFRLACGCWTWRPRSPYVSRQPKRAKCDKHPTIVYGSDAAPTDGTQGGAS